jgi:integrase
MSKEIKSKSGTKDIKVFDRAADVSTHMRNAAVKSKSAVEAADGQAGQTQDTGYSYPSEYASDRLMLMCGHRYGEVAGLSWDMVNFRTGIIKISQAVKRYESKNRVAGDGQPKFYWKIGPPKTETSNRTTKMRHQLTSCLLEWKQLQPLYAPDNTDQNLIFPKANGTLQDYDSFETILRTFLERVDLEPSLYHTRVFRHTFASYCVKNGVKPKTLQRILGHADIVTTLKHYVDTDEESIDEAFDAMESAVVNVSAFSFKNVG